MKRKPEVEPDVVHRRAGQLLASMTRDDLLSQAVACVRSPSLSWVRRAHAAGRLRSHCCGLFELLNHDRPDLPWPGVLFLVGVEAGPGSPACASLCVYLGPDERWTVVEEEPVAVPEGGRRLLVNWAQYAGDPLGPPGVINGDAAEGEAVVDVRRTDPQVSPAAPARGTPRPSRSSGSRGGAARRSRPRKKGSRGGSPKAALPAEAASRPSRLELLVELLRRLD